MIIFVLQFQNKSIINSLNDLRTVTATRYVTPLREGGSLPAIIEADDDGLYVLKFKGAGQGIKALIAELIAGEIARSAGLLIPEIVFVDLNTELARTEGDPEIQDLIKSSGGLNLALDYLPGSIMFNPAADKPDEYLSSLILWFDAFISNVDRTIKNTNMLVWHKNLYLIDHGASLYFHHTWDNYVEKSREPFRFIRDHVFFKFAKQMHKADMEMSDKITSDLLKKIINLVPYEWLIEDNKFNSADECRDAYYNYFMKRMEPPHNFLNEVLYGE